MSKRGTLNQRHVRIGAIALYLGCCWLPLTAQAQSYHPSTVRFDVPGITEDNPPSYQLAVNAKVFWMFSAVVQPTVETAQFIQYMKIAPGEKVLDMGTGSGVLAVLAAETASVVVATDISQLAVDNARHNAYQHGVDGKVDVRMGDLFSAIGGDERFDVILFNIGNPLDNATGETAPAYWALHERFLSQAKHYLTTHGRIYYHGGFLDNIPRSREMMTRYGLRIVEMHMWTANKINSEPLLFVLQAIPEPQP